MRAASTERSASTAWGGVGPSGPRLTGREMSSVMMAPSVGAWGAAGRDAKSVGLVLQRHALHVVPQRALVARVPQQRRGVVRHDQLGAAIAIDPAAEVSDGTLNAGHHIAGHLTDPHVPPR